jgi:hypothetical protein
MNSPGSSVGQYPPVRRNQKTSAMQIRYVVYRSNKIFIFIYEQEYGIQTLVSFGIQIVKY